MARVDLRQGRERMEATKGKPIREPRQGTAKGMASKRQGDRPGKSRRGEAR